MEEHRKPIDIRVVLEQLGLPYSQFACAPRADAACLETEFADPASEAPGEPESEA